MHRYTALVAAAVIGVSAALLAQDSDRQAHALMQQFELASNAGDVNGIAALFTTDALLLDDRLYVGRAAIERHYAAAFAAPFKRATLTIRPGRTVNVRREVRVIEGTYRLAGGSGAPEAGRYVTQSRFETVSGAWRPSSRRGVGAERRPSDAFGRTHSEAY